MRQAMLKKTDSMSPFPSITAEAPNRRQAWTVMSDTSCRFNSRSASLVKGLPLSRGDILARLGCCEKRADMPKTASKRTFGKRSDLNAALNEGS